MKIYYFSALFLNPFLGIFAQEEHDSIQVIDSVNSVKTIVPPVFQLIDSDTISLGEHDELIRDSYTALGVPYVYDALHSFNRRRSDYFGGYINVKINAGLERIRSNGFQSDIKNLYIQIDPQTLTVYWFAVVGPSKDGKCYACIDSRGSAGGGELAVDKQVVKMHHLYSALNPSLLLDFDENVLQCFEWNGTPLPSFENYINIHQKFYKYETDCYDPATDTVVVQLAFNNTGKDTFISNDVAQKQSANKIDHSKSKVYKVKSGDSLSAIAQRYHTSVSSIKRLNHLKSDTIRVGQVLKIP